MAQPILTAKEMQQLDRWAIEERGIPSLTLMENAGLAITDALLSHYPRVRRVLSVVGKGNNGGDGLVVGRLLRARGREAKVFLVSPEEDISGDAKVNLRRARDAGVPVLGPGGGAGALATALQEAELVVDALFGTGLKGAPRGAIREAILAICDAARPVLAVDGPSGVEGDTGRAPGEAVQADHTVALAQLKVGHLLQPGRSLAGEILVADIGIPKQGAPCFPARRRIGPLDVGARWPARAPDCHKGKVGRLLVVAGSRGMLGAACLSAESALRTGAGYVVLAAPEELIDPLAAKLLEVVLKPLPQTDAGVLAPRALPAAVELAERADAIALGPGLGAAERFLELFLAERPDRPCVLDADGLRAARPGLLRPECDVVTPHAGELARLLGLERAAVEDDPLAAASRAPGELGISVLLKGSPTIVGTTAGELIFSDTGNPCMATAGSGDVLTGVIGALAAAGVGVTEAAWMGAWLHGHAGDRAAERLGIGMLARDLRDELPFAIREIDESRRGR